MRIISATNAKLDEFMAARQFRKDPCYRLHILPIHLPSLTERRDDIPLLIEHLATSALPAPRPLP